MYKDNANNQRTEGHQEPPGISQADQIRLKLEAQQYLGDGQIEEALNLYLKVHQFDQTDNSVSVMIGDIYQELGKTAQAVSFFKKVAERHVASSSHAKALVLLEKIIHVQPTDLASREKIVAMHLKLRRETQELQRIRKHEDQAIQQLRLLAEHQMRQLCHDEAAAYYRQITEIDPFDTEASLKLATMLRKVNRRKEAVVHLIAAAKGLLQKRMTKEASEVIMEVSKLDDGNPDIKALFFRMQLAEGYVKVGLEGLHKLHRENPKNLEVIQTLGRAYVSFNQLDVARDWFMKGFRINGQSAPLEHVGIKLVAEGNPDGAFRALFPVSDKLARESNFVAAIEVLMHIHKKGDHLPTLEQLFRYYHGYDDPHRAMEILEIILQIFSAEGRGQEGLTHVWTLLEQQTDANAWRKRLEELVSTFISTGNNRIPPRPFPGAKTPHIAPKPRRHLTLEERLNQLPGKHAFREELRQAMRNAKKHNKLVALLILDIDRRKWDRGTGDKSTDKRTLSEVLSRLNSCLKPEDVISHLGRDEYAIMLQGLTMPENVLRILGQLVKAFEEPINATNLAVKTNGSLGIALYPNDGDSPKILFEKADKALARAREKKNASFALFTEQIPLGQPNRQGLDRELLTALKNNELELHYQPIVNLQSEVWAVHGAEALVRWKHPELGTLYPNQFLSVAGESGNIVRLGKYVLSKAIHQIKNWYDSGFNSPFLSLNISAEQAKDHSFLAYLKKSIEATPLPKGVLKIGFESSENLMLENSEETRTLLHYMRRLGIDLAIDDFGKGTASAVHLQRSPVQVVKIDASYVRQAPKDKSAEEFVRGIVGLAHAFNLKVVAEGIESAEQANLMKEIGCEYAQGFFFSKPLPPKGMEPYLGGTPLNPGGIIAQAC